MNRLWIVPCLCILMLAASWYPASDTVHYQQRSENALQTILYHAEHDQWSDATHNIRTLYKAHTSYARHAGWYASDDRLFAVRDALWDMDAYASTANLPEFLSACARFRAALQSLVQEQRLTLAGVL